MLVLAKLVILDVYEFGKEYDAELSPLLKPTFANWHVDADENIKVAYCKTTYVVIPSVARITWNELALVEVPPLADTESHVAINALVGKIGSNSWIDASVDESVVFL